MLDAGKPDEYPIGLGREVRAGSLSVAVFRASGGRWYALENKTPHAKGGSLAEAIVSGDYLYCPVRDLKIALGSGEVQAPDTGQVRTFDIRVEDNRVRISIPKQS
ncbi:nitrite reductase (NAD(P)H) small subunit [Cohnella lubricantis]|uniref:Nitrite reductase (NAD(P)H) small subunit n=2 Tax=Cohnella lubricantis TaxID=2163172 RepID=A0A841TFR6_9BACL|nr:nitrite reductase (NAD(P)H) small subunit [Cohnella lubricantis]